MKAPSVCTANLAACVPPRALLTGCLHGMHMSSLLSLLWSKPTGFSQEETSARLTGCFFQGCPDRKTCHELDQALPWTVLQTSQETSCPLTFTPRDAEHTTPSCPSVDVQFWQCLSLSGEFQTSTKKKEVQDVIIIDPGSVELCRELRKDLCQA